MIIKQLSIFIENISGRLNAVTSVLAENNINIRAMSLADTSDFGVLRLIVDQPEEAEKILSGKNFTVKLVDVIAIEMNDTPGGLNSILKKLEDCKINIEYMYAFIGALPSKAMVIVRVDKIPMAIDCLQSNHNIRVVSSKEILGI